MGHVVIQQCTCSGAMLLLQVRAEDVGEKANVLAIRSLDLHSMTDVDCYCVRKCFDV